jgi:hypothetical protein
LYIIARVSQALAAFAFRANQDFYMAPHPGSRDCSKYYWRAFIKTFFDFTHPEVYYPYARETMSLL